MHETIIRRSPLDGLVTGDGVRWEMRNGWRILQEVLPLWEVEEQLQSAALLLDVTDWGRAILEAAPEIGEGVVAAACGVGAQPALTGRRGEELGVYRLRPDRYLFVDERGRDGELVERLEAAAAGAEGLVTVTNVTDGEAAVYLWGAAAPEILSRLCGLDLDERAFPDQGVRQSSVAKTRQTIIRRDQGGQPGYVLCGGRSYAVYLWRTILQAGKPLGLWPAGRQALLTANS